MEFTRQDLDRISDNPLYKTLGIEVVRVGDDRAETEMRPPVGVCWPFEGQPHGGMLFTQIDTTMAWAVLTDCDRDQNCATIDISIQYTSRARKGPFACRAEVIHRTGRMAYTRAEVFDAEGTMVAAANGVFRVVKGAWF